MRAEQAELPMVMLIFFFIVFSNLIMITSNRFCHMFNAVDLPERGRKNFLFSVFLPSPKKKLIEITKLSFNILNMLNAPDFIIFY